MDEIDDQLIERPDRLVNESSEGRRRAISSIEVDYNRYHKEAVLRRRVSTSPSQSPSDVDTSQVRFCGDVHCVAPPETVGSLDYLSSKYESLDYDQIENMLFLDEKKRIPYSRVRMTEILRWTIIFFIGLLTALTAVLITVSVEILSKYKYQTLQTFVGKCSRSEQNYCIVIPFAVWLAFNAIPVGLGSALVTYVAPIAAGSGIPVIKCYLNGVKVPEVVRIKTYFAKLLGVILSVVGGLACGKEGPMIHCGAVIAAGISQGKSTTFKKDSTFMQEFRDDREKRDFVSAGNLHKTQTPFMSNIFCVSLFRSRRRSGRCFRSACRRSAVQPRRGRLLLEPDPHVAYILLFDGIHVYIEFSSVRISLTSRTVVLRWSTQLRSVQNRRL